MEEPGQKEAEDIFDSWEKDFQVVLSELAVDKSNRGQLWTREYEKVIQALRKSHDDEKKLMSKCKELTAELVSSSTKAATALKIRKIRQEDEATIVSLKRELDQAWKIIQDKEKKHRETILNLEQEVTNLKEITEQPDMSMDEEHNVNDLLQSMEEVTKERDQLRTKVETLEDDLSKATAAQQEMESQKDSALQGVSQLQQELQINSSREMRWREKLKKEMKEMKQMRTHMEASETEAKAKTLQVQLAKEGKEEVEQKLKEKMVLWDQTNKKLEQMQVRNTKFQQDNEQLSSALEQLSLESQQIANDLKMKEEEVNQMQQEITKQTKMKEATQKKLQQMEDQQANVKDLRETIKALNKDLDAYQKQIEIGKKTRDLLNKSNIKATQETEKLNDLVKLKEHDNKCLEQEIHSYHQEAQKQRKIIQQLEKDRDRYINDNSNLMQKGQQHIGDLELKEMEIFEYKKKLAEMDRNLKHQCSLFESVMSEKSSCSKALLEAQDKITELRKMLESTNSQSVQLRNELSGYELTQAKDQQVHERLSRDNEALKAELQLLRQQIDELNQHINSYMKEDQKKLKIIADGDAEKIHIKKQLDQRIQEQDILGQQLLRRNDERALLYEKIKILNSLMFKGNVQYNQRLEDIRVLRLEIKRVWREMGIRNKALPTVIELRQELFHTQKELIHQSKRCSIQQQEKPVQIRHWRTMEAKDPSKYEFIQKIQALQKRLISKTQDVVDTHLLVQEKDRLYVELKHVLARRPGLEAAEQLQQSQWTIRDRTKKLKAKTAEADMLYSMCKEYKSEIQRLLSEVTNIKRTYIEKQHNRDQTSKCKVEEKVVQPQSNNKPHFTGGGFRINKPCAK